MPPSLPGKQLREFRRDTGLSQTQFGEIMQWGGDTKSNGELQRNLEVGRKRFTMLELERMVKACEEFGYDWIRKGDDKWKSFEAGIKYEKQLRDEINRQKKSQKPPEPNEIPISKPPEEEIGTALDATIGKWEEEIKNPPPPEPEPPKVDDTHEEKKDQPKEGEKEVETEEPKKEEPEEKPKEPESGKDEVRTEANPARKPFRTYAIVGFLLVAIFVIVYLATRPSPVEPLSDDFTLIRSDPIVGGTWRVWEHSKVLSGENYTVGLRAGNESPEPFIRFCLGVTNTGQEALSFSVHPGHYKLYDDRGKIYKPYQEAIDYVLNIEPSKTASTCPPEGSHQYQMPFDSRAKTLTFEFYDLPGIPVASWTFSVIR